jgi:hypothetical protein
MFNDEFPKPFFSPDDPGGAPPVDPPADPPSDSPVSLVNPDGTYTEGWLDHLDVDDETKADQQLRTHKGLADTAKNIHELMKLRGHHVVPIPPEGSEDPKLWDEVYNRLGRPESPDKYTAPKLDGIPEQHRMPDDVLKGVRELMHANGISDRQWQGIVTGWNGMVQQQLQAAEANRAKALDPLKEEWAGQFESNLALTEKFLRSNVPPERFDSAMQAAQGHPDLMKLLHQQAKAHVEGEPDLNVPPPSVLAAAQTELDKLTRGDSKTPYFDRYHPEHGRVIQRADELRKLIAQAQPKKPQQESFSLQM